MPGHAPSWRAAPPPTLPSAQRRGTRIRGPVFQRPLVSRPLPATVNTGYRARARSIPGITTRSLPRASRAVGVGQSADPGRELLDDQPERTAMPAGLVMARPRDALIESVVRHRSCSRVAWRPVSALAQSYGLGSRPMRPGVGSPGVSTGAARGHRVGDGGDDRPLAAALSQVPQRSPRHASQLWDRQLRCAVGACSPTASSPCSSCARPSSG